MCSYVGLKMEPRKTSIWELFTRCSLHEYFQFICSPIEYFQFICSPNEYFQFICLSNEHFQFKCSLNEYPKSKCSLTEYSNFYVDFNKIYIFNLYVHRMNVLDYDFMKFHTLSMFDFSEHLLDRFLHV